MRFFSFKPKHTVSSTAKMLAEGLEDGSFVLSDKAASGEGSPPESKRKGDKLLQEKVRKALDECPQIDRGDPVVRSASLPERPEGDSENKKTSSQTQDKPNDISS